MCQNFVDLFICYKQKCEVVSFNVGLFAYGAILFRENCNAGRFLDNLRACVWHTQNLPCLGPSSWLRIGGHWHGHKGSPCASVLCVLNTLCDGYSIQSIAWCRQSSVSVVFLGVFFRQQCHVERACRDHPLEPRGRSTVVFSSWLLPGSDVPTHRTDCLNPLTPTVAIWVLSVRVPGCQKLQMTA